MTDAPTGIARAIEAAGGAMALARILNVSHQVVYAWRLRGWVPAERALQLEARYRIPRAKLVNDKIAKLFTH